MPCSHCEKALPGSVVTKRGTIYVVSFLPVIPHIFELLLQLDILMLSRVCAHGSIRYILNEHSLRAHERYELCLQAPQVVVRVLLL